MDKLSAADAWVERTEKRRKVQVTGRELLAYYNGWEDAIRNLELEEQDFQLDQKERNKVWYEDDDKIWKEVKNEIRSQ
jgi:hypothetical protein